MIDQCSTPDEVLAAWRASAHQTREAMRKRVYGGAAAASHTSQIGVRGRTPEIAARVQIVAGLASEGHGQSEIARRLKITPDQAKHALMVARADGLLPPRVPS
ncbi:MAG: hypothetical protein KDK24_10085 [Pseudooceanicola sp.]|nr:hypothetical protein [Pseudooceanicola sp.]